MTQIDYWTYAADSHCVDCAAAAFGAGALDSGTARDGEGNEPRPVFSTDEGAADEYGHPVAVACGTCLAVCRVDMPKPEADSILIVDGEYGQYDEAGYVYAIREWLRTEIHGNADYLVNWAAVDAALNGGEDAALEAVDAAIRAANTVLDATGSDMSLVWHPDRCGVLMAATEEWAQ